MTGRSAMRSWSRQPARAGSWGSVRLRGESAAGTLAEILRQSDHTSVLPLLTGGPGVLARSWLATRRE